MQQNPRRFQHLPSGKHRCLECSHRRSVFAFRGRVRADADHTLCPRCYRSHRQRLHNWFAFGVVLVSSETHRRASPAWLKNNGANDDTQ
jgi:hypothetical protein